MQIKFIPGVHPSYRSQFDKLTEAYIKGKVHPFYSCACFVGNLLNNQSGWARVRTFVKNVPMLESYYISVGNACILNESNGLYTPKEIIALEALFLSNMKSFDVLSLDEQRYTEEELFIAFEKTLDLLKTIHESKGEVIDEVPTFKKRENVYA